MEHGERHRIDWIQFGMLLLSIFGVAVYNEGRLSRMEQMLSDAKERDQQIEQRLENLEQTWRLSHPIHNPSPKEQ